jgi:hypothetical protein
METTLDTLEQRVKDTGICHFFRGQIACAISQNAGEFYWGHIGLIDGQELYGRLFVKVGSERMYHVAMPITGNRALDKRWWLGFEGSRALSYRATLDELKGVADQLQSQDAA